MNSQEAAPSGPAAWFLFLSGGMALDNKMVYDKGAKV
jgi:hypothetical protein